MITFGSICSGIEAASVAWSVMPWKAVWLAEIEKAPSEILATHYPDVPNLGDMMTIQGRLQRREIPAPDILVGGTPCQSFSVAGLRGGLSDDRGALTLEFIKIANEIDEQRDTETKCVIVWENVPGVLTSKDNAFGCFLAGLAGEDQPLQPSGKKWSNSGCVFGPQRTIAWRVLDAQYFGLAQRRKRVFVIASARTGFDAAAVLLEFDGLRRDSAPSREAAKKIAGTIGTGAEISGFRMTAFGEYSTDGTASTMKARDYKDATDLVVAVAHRDVMPTMVSGGSTPGSKRSMSGQFKEEYLTPCLTIALQDITGRAKAQNGKGWSDDGVSYTLDAAATQGVASCVHGTQDPIVGINIAHCLGRNSGQENALVYPGQNLKLMVRRLMPVECERLQGFPDGYTAITVRGKPLADGPRYKALGNSMAVLVMRWLGLRIWMMLTTRTGRLPGTKEQS